jgi:broad specificity phosphatase PhoE
MELRLFAVRHGATAWSRERRFAGSQDIPLSPEGRRQCEALADAFAPLPLAAVYASPLARARESAAAIAAARGIDLMVAPDFREMCFGDWEGLARDEVERRFPDDFAVWRSTPERFARPGSEPLDAVAGRVMRGLEDLRSAHHGGAVIVVTHAVVTRLLVLAALGLGPERLWSVDASPAGISEIEYRDDWAVVHRVNTLSHLEERADADSRSATGSPGRSERTGGMGGPSRPPIRS